MGGILPVNIQFLTILKQFLAGKSTTDAELEEMLEQGNSAVFTQGVSFVYILIEMK